MTTQKYLKMNSILQSKKAMSEIESINGVQNTTEAEKLILSDFMNK